MLVGAAVDIRYTMQAGIAAVLMILCWFKFRAAGVSLCMLGTKLNKKERLFCVIAYLPKSNSTGSDWFSTACNGIAVRTDRFVCSCSCYSDNSAPGGSRNGSDL